MISAKLCVPPAAPFHLSGGETSGPSHVNFLGIVPPAENAAVVS